jgi:hypothetical protein
MNRLISLIPVVFDQEPVLACPHCGGINIHPTSVRCNPAGDLPGQVRIEESGVLWNGNAEPDGRGVRIDLVFWCERGHSFGLVFHFQKGNTLVKRNMSPADPPTETIWRN